MRHRQAAFILPMLIGLCASPVWATVGLTISPTFDSSITSDPNAATIESTINQTIQVYETRFTNPINVSLYFTETSSGLGASETGLYYLQNYSDYRDALIADKAAAGASDSDILANLPMGNNPVPGNSGAGVETSGANFRALGYNAPGYVNINGVDYDTMISLNIGIMNCHERERRAQASTI